VGEKGGSLVFGIRKRGGEEGPTASRSSSNYSSLQPTGRERGERKSPRREKGDTVSCVKETRKRISRVIDQSIKLVRPTDVEINQNEGENEGGSRKKKSGT